MEIQSNGPNTLLTVTDDFELFGNLASRNEHCEAHSECENGIFIGEGQGKDKGGNGRWKTVRRFS